MTPDEHVAAAEELAAAAADLIRITADEALPERMQAAETARAMAAIGRLHVDLSVVRQVHMDRLFAAIDGEHESLERVLDGLSTHDAEVAPVLDLPMRADKRKALQVGDVKDCECCGTSITAVPSNGTFLWAETETSILHDCPPPEPVPLEQYCPPAFTRRAPADAPAEAPNQHPRKD